MTYCVIFILCRGGSQVLLHPTLPATGHFLPLYFPHCDGHLFPPPILPGHILHGCPPPLQLAPTTAASSSISLVLLQEKEVEKKKVLEEMTKHLLNLSCSTHKSLFFVIILLLPSKSEL